MCYFNKELDRDQTAWGQWHGLFWDYSRGGKWSMILRDGQRAQVAEESQQMPLSGVETKQLLPHLNKMMKLY